MTILNNNLIDKSLLMSASLCLTLSTYFFFHNSASEFKSFNTVNSQLIGHLKEFKNDARRKGGGSFIWSPAIENMQIHDGDTVYTGDESMGKIELDKGQMIQLSPNSLIVLKTNQTKMELNLEFGKFTGNLSKNESLIIHSGQNRIEIKANDENKFSIEKAKDSDPAIIKSLKGQMEISTSANEKPIIISENKKIDITEFSNINTLQNQINDSFDFSEALASVQELEIPSLENIDFNWTGQGNASSFQLSISKSLDFSVLENAIKVNSNPEDPLNKNKISFNPNGLAPDIYFWRIEALNNYGQMIEHSQIQKFVLIPPQPPYFTILNKNAITPNDKIHIEWTHREKPSLFRIEISQNLDFKVNTISHEFAQSNYLIENLPIGHFFIRVGEYKSKQLVWSNVESIDVVDSETKRNLASETASTVAPVAAVAESPVVPSPSLTPATHPNPDSSSSLNALPKNTKTDQIQKAHDTPKEDRPVVTSLETPILSNPKNGVSITTRQKDFQITFKWKEVPQADSYEIQISANENFENYILKKKVNINHFLWKPNTKEKTFFWRVNALETHFKVKSDFSQTAKFKISDAFDPTQSD